MSEALNHDRINAEISKLIAEAGKLNAETAKFHVEATKLRREAIWYPAAVAAGLIGSISAVTLLVARLIVM